MTIICHQLRIVENRLTILVSDLSAIFFCSLSFSALKVSADWMLLLLSPQFAGFLFWFSHCWSRGWWSAPRSRACSAAGGTRPADRSSPGPCCLPCSHPASDPSAVSLTIIGTIYDFFWYQTLQKEIKLLVELRVVMRRAQTSDRRQTFAHS